MAMLAVRMRFRSALKATGLGRPWFGAGAPTATPPAFWASGAGTASGALMFVKLTPVRLRCEVRRVGLDEQPVFGHRGGGLAEPDARRVRHRPREREHQPAADPLGDLSRALAVAVDHSCESGVNGALRPPYDALVDDRAQTRSGVAHVEHDRHLKERRERELRAQRALLFLERRAPTREVHPDLADRNHAVLPRELEKTNGRGLGPGCRAVWMHADGDANLRVALGERDGRLARAKVLGAREDPRHTRDAGTLEHRGEVGCESR